MGWKRFCSSYGKASEDLCKAIARVARRINTSYVDPKGLMSFTACCLIALDKNPGVAKANWNWRSPKKNNWEGHSYDHIN